MKKKRSLKPSTFINSKITATISISLVLFLLGLVIFLSLFANNLSNYVKESFSFNIVLQDNINDAQISRLQKLLDNSLYVKSTTYKSKEDALKELESELGQDIEDFLGVIPLPAVIEVKLNSHYVNPDSIAVIESQIMHFSNHIKEIEYRKQLIRDVNENLREAGFIIFGLAIILLFVSFALISNTIRLMIYSKRFLIHTMKLVGAKSSFIRKPFVMSNIISGIIAAFIAIGLLGGLLYYILNDYSDFAGWIGESILWIVFGSILVLGILISILATRFAVNKYIKMGNDDLYYI